MIQPLSPRRYYLLMLTPDLFVLLLLLLYPIVTSSDIVAIHPDDISSFSCSKSRKKSNQESFYRQCTLTNVGFVNGEIIFVTSNLDDIFVPPKDFPNKILCSVADQPALYREYCPIRIVNVSESRALFRDNTCQVGSAIAMHRLCPSNLYHSLFEELIPAFGMIRSNVDAQTQGGKHSRTFAQIQEHRWAIFVTDSHGDDSGQISRILWKTFLPLLLIVMPANSVDEQSAGKCWARKLIIGTRAACVHWRHCVGRGDYSPRNSAYLFTRFALDHLGLLQTQQGKDGRKGSRMTAVHNKPSSSAVRITFVQRAWTRRLENVDLMTAAASQVVTSILSQLDGNTTFSIRTINFEDHSLIEQITIAHNTDILVMVHGGAIGHIAWLPQGALLIDMYPYAYPIDQFPLVHGVRRAMPKLGIKHWPMQLDNPTGHITDGKPLPAGGCICPNRACVVNLFWSINSITIDIKHFTTHFRSAFLSWLERGDVMEAPPLSKQEAYLIAKEYDQRFVVTNNTTAICYPKIFITIDKITNHKFVGKDLTAENLQIEIKWRGYDVLEWTPYLDLLSNPLHSSNEQLQALVDSLGIAAT